MTKTLIFNVIFLLFSTFVYGQKFSPTPVEFQSWDARCKLAFTAAKPQGVPGVYEALSKTESAQALAFGEAAGGAWHYCMGLIYLSRAQSSIGRTRDGFLKRAVSEINFTARNIDSEHSWYTEIQVNMAKAYYLSGDKPQAIALLQSLIKNTPINSLPYSALAYYLKQNGQLNDAILTLQAAPLEVKQQSAELNYFLGWYLMEQGNLADAASYAAKAYELGYPVPTLKQRLQAAGQSVQ